MISCKTKLTPAQRVEEMIFLIRGQRVMLDFDLARTYGATTKRSKEQFRRNAERFPDDFAFQLTAQELANLRSQFATSSSHGGSRHLPTAFTERGAIMLASVLNNKIAVDAGVRVVRAFIFMREQLTAPEELAKKLNEWENRISGHDAAIANLFEAIRQLTDAPPPVLPEDRPKIGFMRETAPRYRFRRMCRN
jgi:ORF6N domain